MHASKHVGTQQPLMDSPRTMLHCPSSCLWHAGAVQVMLVKETVAWNKGIMVLPPGVREMLRVLNGLLVRLAAVELTVTQQPPGHEREQGAYALYQCEACLRLLACLRNRKPYHLCRAHLGIGVLSDLNVWQALQVQLPCWHSCGQHLSLSGSAAS